MHRGISNILTDAQLLQLPWRWFTSLARFITLDQALIGQEAICVMFELAQAYTGLLLSTDTAVRQSTSLSVSKSAGWGALDRPKDAQRVLSSSAFAQVEPLAIWALHERLIALGSSLSDPAVPLRLLCSYYDALLSCLPAKARADCVKPDQAGTALVAALGRYAQFEQDVVDGFDEPVQLLFCALHCLIRTDTYYCADLARCTVRQRDASSLDPANRF